jgi:hypothetical protein
MEYASYVAFTCREAFNPSSQLSRCVTAPFR